MYYLFDTNGNFLATCDHEPNLDDLASRGEQAIFSEQVFNYPHLVDGKIIEQGKQPSPFHHWQNGQWVISPEKQAELLKTQQAEVWEKIKQRRYENSLGGVFIPSIGKWFQTGEEEKTKYLGLDKVIDKLGEIDWKCADNTFVKMNRALLDEIFLMMVKTENADHINAEKHRLAMLAAENPLTYDFSTGWSAIYQEQTNG